MRAVPLSRYIVFFAIASGGCALDLATKSWLFDWPTVAGGRIYWIWPGVFGLLQSLNPGALWGIGQGMVAVFAALSIAAAVGILIWLFYARAARDWLLTVALGAIMAGILGNLYDRLGLPGLDWGTFDPNRAGQTVHAVRDWIQVYIGTYPWPTFNIADSMLVCGAGLLLWHAFVNRHSADGNAGRQDTAANP
jgi:signal peptidase II